MNDQQQRALADLFEGAERMVELYWDTDTGKRLSRSQGAARDAFRSAQRQVSDTAPVQSTEAADNSVCKHAWRIEDSDYDLDQMMAAIEHGEGFVIRASCSLCGIPIERKYEAPTTSEMDTEMATET